jgi:exopolysaccharide biosynthesis protein
MKHFFKILAVTAVCFNLCSAPVRAEGLTDVTTKTFEYEAITSGLERGWIKPLTTNAFGYGAHISPDDWFFLLMFLRTSDACPELGSTPNAYWTKDNIQTCLAGAGVPTLTAQLDRVRRDEAMQQLFALRRRSFAFQRLQTKPVDYVDPLDLAEVASNRQGAMIAADRLKLIFRSSQKLLPAAPLLREDAVFSVWRFLDWEKQGGTDQETKDEQVISKEAKLTHWRDLDTDIYVVQVKTGGDTTIRPILPRRSFNPAKDPKTEKVRDEFVYQPVSALAKESGALAAINGSYFNVEWPWGALEDVAIVNGKTYLERTDRSTFVVCQDGSLYIGKLVAATLQNLKCKPQQALGAGPMFLAGGEILTEASKESFDEYTQWERRVGKNARTAIAISKDRKMAYLIVVAGKSYPAFGRGGSSLGAFLKSKYPDLESAMMFDGGGSSALYANGDLLVGMGVSGGQTERSVVSALGVFSLKADKLSVTAVKKEQAKRWDSEVVRIKVPKPTKAFAWEKVSDVVSKKVEVEMMGARGSGLQLKTGKGVGKSFDLTFDLLAESTSTALILTRRQGTHERGWKIPTELQIIDPKDGSATDIIKLFGYLPEVQKPDLKTFDVLAVRPTGIVFGDATGRVWFYYAKDKQLSPAKLLEPAKTTKKK